MGHQQEDIYHIFLKNLFCKMEIISLPFIKLAHVLIDKSNNLK